MPKYRKKPVVVEAIQFTGDVLQASDFIKGKKDTETLKKHVSEECYKQLTSNEHYIIQTLDGAMKVTKGDYIIKGVQGEFYPCKPDIFEATYERVDER